MLRSERRNSAKMACCSAGGMPSPVSRTRTVTPCAPVSSARLTSPRAVNLTALLIRLIATWRSRVRSPHTQGPVSGNSARQASPLSWANCRPIAATKPSAWPRSTNSLVRRNCPASLLARSSTSPISPPRCWALAWMRSTSCRRACRQRRRQRRAVGFARLQQDAAQPHDQVQGRAQLMGDGGEEAALQQVRLLGQAPAFGGLAVELRRVECSGQLLGDGAVQVQLRRIEDCKSELAAWTDQRQQRQAEWLIHRRQARRRKCMGRAVDAPALPAAPLPAGCSRPPGRPRPWQTPPPRQHRCPSPAGAAPAPGRPAVSSRAVSRWAVSWPIRSTVQRSATT